MRVPALPRTKKKVGLLVMIGGSELFDGVNEFDAADAGPVPTELIACTEQVYAMLLVSPVMTMGEEFPLADCAPQVSLYPVRTAPPTSAGGEKVTVALASPRVAVPITGAAGRMGLIVIICVIDVAAL